MSKTVEMPPHGNTKYPWELWEDGQTHIARAGRHFSISADSFRRSLQKHAADMRSRGHKVKVKTNVSRDEKVVTFFFYEPEE